MKLRARRIVKCGQIGMSKLVILAVELTSTEPTCHCVAERKLRAIDRAWGDH